MPPEPWAPAAQQAQPQPRQPTYLTVSVPRASLGWDAQQKATLGMYEVHCEARASLRAGMSSWLIARRYSSFVLLREHVEKTYPSDVVQQLPPFPPKYLWGNTDPKVLEERRAMFNKYLSTMMTSSEGEERDEVVQRFLYKGRVPVVAEGCTYQEAVAAASAAFAAGVDKQDRSDAATAVPVGDGIAEEKSPGSECSRAASPAGSGVALDADEGAADGGAEQDEDDDFVAPTLSLEEIMRLRGFESPVSMPAEEEQVLPT
eukprot:COSAG02_NODE_11226_length_1767_cov_1.223621_1_plen_259_part_10